MKVRKGEIVAASPFGWASVKFVGRKKNNFWYINLASDGEGDFGLEGTDLIFDVDGKRFKSLNRIIDYLTILKWKEYREQLEDTSTLTHLHHLGFDVFYD